MNCCGAVRMPLRLTVTLGTAIWAIVGQEYTAPRCPDGLALLALSPKECPMNAILPSCDRVGGNELCEADGECGTDNNLNNCGDLDIYRKACIEVETQLTASTVRGMCGHQIYDGLYYDIDRSPSAHGCDESYTSSVRLALANGLFGGGDGNVRNCASQCLYDMEQPTTRAYIYKSHCWRLTTCTDNTCCLTNVTNQLSSEKAYALQRTEGFCRKTMGAFRYIGVGWCMPSNCELSHSSCDINGFWKKFVDQDTCQAMCEDEVHCVGFASSSPTSKQPNTCYIYATSGSVPFGWNAYPKPRYSIGSSSGENGVSCYRRDTIAVMCEAWPAEQKYACTGGSAYTKLADTSAPADQCESLCKAAAGAREACCYWGATVGCHMSTGGRVRVQAGTGFATMCHPTRDVPLKSISVSKDENEIFPLAPSFRANERHFLASVKALDSFTISARSLEFSDLVGIEFIGPSPINGNLGAGYNGCKYARQWKEDWFVAALNFGYYDYRICAFDPKAHINTSYYLTIHSTTMANLSSIEVGRKAVVSPKFDPWRQHYSVEVPLYVTELPLNVSSQDPEAMIGVIFDGNEQLTAMYQNVNFEGHAVVNVSLNDVTKPYSFWDIPKWSQNVTVKVTSPQYLDSTFYVLNFSHKIPDPLLTSIHVSKGKGFATPLFRQSFNSSTLHYFAKTECIDDFTISAGGQLGNLVGIEFDGDSQADGNLADDHRCDNPKAQNDDWFIPALGKPGEFVYRICVFVATRIHKSYYLTVQSEKPRHGHLSCCLNSKYFYKDKCISSCPKGHYSIINGTRGGNCRPCTPQCVHCKDAYTCSQCEPHTYHFKGKCLSECPYGHYPGESEDHFGTKTCLPCEANCGRCFGPRDACTECTNFKLLYKDLEDGSRTGCVSKCPSGHFISGSGKSGKACKACDASDCMACSDATTCTQCADSKILYKGLCLSECPRGTYEEELEGSGSGVQSLVCKKGKNPHPGQIIKIRAIPKTTTTTTTTSTTVQSAPFPMTSMYYIFGLVLFLLCMYTFGSFCMNSLFKKPGQSEGFAYVPLSAPARTPTQKPLQRVDAGAPGSPRSPRLREALREETELSLLSAPVPGPRLGPGGARGRSPSPVQRSLATDPAPGIRDQRNQSALKDLGPSRPGPQFNKGNSSRRPLDNVPASSANAIQDRAPPRSLLDLQSPPEQAPSAPEQVPSPPAEEPPESNEQEQLWLGSPPEEQPSAPEEEQPSATVSSGAMAPAESSGWDLTGSMQTNVGGAEANPVVPEVPEEPAPAEQEPSPAEQEVSPEEQLDGPPAEQLDGPPAETPGPDTRGPTPEEVVRRFLVADAVEREASGEEARPTLRG